MEPEVRVEKAAPEMYEALKQLLPWAVMDDDGDAIPDEDMSEKLLAAVTKARSALAAVEGTK